MTEFIKANFNIKNNNFISGILDIKSKKKELILWSPEYININTHSDIYGKTHDNKKITLLDCIVNNNSHFNRQGERSYGCNIYFHTLIIGDSEINKKDDRFCSISLEVNNSSTLFRFFKNFSYIHSPDETLINAINSQKNLFGGKVNENAIVSYFNGNFKIFEQDTKIGKIKATNNIVTSGGNSVNGINIKNTIILTISFDKAVFLKDAFSRAHELSSFLRLIGGRGLAFNNISLKKHGDELSAFNVLHNSFSWGDNMENTYHSSPLIDIPSDDFNKILKNWFDKTERKDVRYNFYNTYFKNIYSPNRLIIAANMFDVFPSDNKKKELSLEERELLSELKIKIKTDFIDHQEIKDKLLNSIGILSRCSLKDRIMERLEIIKPYPWVNFENLAFIVDKAIQCRNYFVHGTKVNKLEQEKIIGHLSLFITTFEYIYAVSELVECGLEMNFDISVSHPIIAFKDNIEFDLLDLRKDFL